MPRYTKSEISGLRIAAMLRWLWVTRALIPLGAFLMIFIDIGLPAPGGRCVNADDPLVFVLTATSGWPGRPVTILVSLLCLGMFKSLLWRCESLSRTRFGLTLVWTLVLWHLAVPVVTRLPDEILAPRGASKSEVMLRCILLTEVMVVSIWAVGFRGLTARFLKGLGFFQKTKPATLSSKPVAASGKTPVL